MPPPLPEAEQLLEAGAAAGMQREREDELPGVPPLSEVAPALHR